jgi:hypothetical protein
MVSIKLWSVTKTRFGMLLLPPVLVLAIPVAAAPLANDLSAPPLQSILWMVVGVIDERVLSVLSMSMAPTTPPRRLVIMEDGS